MTDGSTRKTGHQWNTEVTGLIFSALTFLKQLKLFLPQEESGISFLSLAQVQRCPVN